MVKAYNFTPGNMECADDAIIKILLDWPPSNEPSAYLYETKSHITTNTCDRTNENTATETLVQLYRNYCSISEAIRNLQDPVQINNYTWAACEKEGDVAQMGTFNWGRKCTIAHYTH